MANYIGTPGDDTWTGGDEDDYAVGSDGNDILTGLGGKDFLLGGKGDDVLSGGDGDDTLWADFGKDTVDGGAGWDQVQILMTDETHDVVYDARAAMTAEGTILVDGTVVRNTEGLEIVTGSGNDTIIVTEAQRSFFVNGGEGKDTLVLDMADFAGNVYAKDGRIGTGLGSERYRSTAAVEAFVIHSGSGNDTLSGFIYDDEIHGGAGRDLIYYSGGRDILDGGAGQDTLTSFFLHDATEDIIFDTYAAATDAGCALGNGVVIRNIEVTGQGLATGSGNDTWRFAVDPTQYFYIWNAGAGIDTLDVDFHLYTVALVLEQRPYNTEMWIGPNSRPNLAEVYHVEIVHIIGGTGDDTFNGWLYDDRLDGGMGADSLAGGQGDDTYVVDNAGDRVVELKNEGTDTVVSSISFSLSGLHVENLTLTGVGNLTATGNGFDNQLTGNSGQNVLYGSLGADTMAGGAGNDTYQVENAGDVVVEQAGEGIDTVVAMIDWHLADQVENLSLNGTASIAGYGNALDNVIRGNGGNNRLDAGPAGADVLIGGAGDDSYIVDHASVTISERASEGIDTVYAAGNWRLGAHLENLNLTAAGAATGNELSNSITGSDGNDTIDGKGGNDILTGGAGRDGFFFRAGSGVDIITDFQAYVRGGDYDRINVNAYSHSTAFGGGITVIQDGADTVIDLGGGNVVTVLNSAVAAVTAAIYW